MSSSPFSPFALAVNPELNYGSSFSICPSNDSKNTNKECHSFTPSDPFTIANITADTTATVTRTDPNPITCTYNNSKNIPSGVYLVSSTRVACILSKVESPF